MASCRDVLHGEVERGYGHLPREVVKEWATKEADLSEQFVKGKIAGVSETEEGRNRKAGMMKKISDAFHERADERHLDFYKQTGQALFETRLEDPGLLHNFEYFDIPSSDYMLMFYLSMWTGRMADAMIYLHNHGWDLRGNFNSVPREDVWYQMSCFEGMNINERIKAKSVNDFLRTLSNEKEMDFPLHVTAFGGGNLPERLYGELPKMELTVFDDGAVRNVEELFPESQWQQQHTTYIKKNLLLSTQEERLVGKQDFVWMHGVSMYLGKELTIKALLSGYALLKNGGCMKYDYLIMTESMRRVLATQGWPKGRGEMDIFATAQEASNRAREVTAAVNDALCGNGFFDIEDIQTTLVEPWGATSVRITMRKYA